MYIYRESNGFAMQQQTMYGKCFQANYPVIWTTTI